MDSKLYVGNLPYRFTDDQLRELFSQAGQIKEAVIITDRETRRSKGFGFVEMTSAQEAEKAIQMFNNYEIDGRRLTVNIARPREEHGQRDGRGRGADRGGDRGGSRRPY